MPADELEHRTHEVAELFAAMPTRAVWHTKRLLDAAQETTFAEQLELEAVTQAEMTQTHDFTEGVAAFLEKRTGGVHRRRRRAAAPDHGPSTSTTGAAGD